MTNSEAEKKHSDRWGNMGFDALVPIEKQFIVVCGFAGDVNNGGFDQYFHNSSGDLSDFALDGLERIEDGETQKILLQAMQIIPKGWVADQDARQDRMETTDCLQRESAHQSEPLQ